MPASNARLDRLIAWSRAALGWEAVWRAGTTLVALVALFLAISWFGVWDVLPKVVRPLGVAAFVACAICLAIVALRRTRLDRAAAIARLDRGSNDPHGVASALNDAPANADADPTTAALWRLHMARLEGKLKAVRVAPPSPRAIDMDSRALRAGAVVLAIVAAIVAGPEKFARLRSAFDWTAGGASSASNRLDAWIDPPAYTGKPPVLLTGLPETDERAGTGRRVAAPVGSTVVIRASDGSDADFRTEGALEPLAAADPTPVAVRSKTFERRMTLKGDARLQIGGRQFEVVAIPDLPPTIEVLEQPRANYRGSLGLAYKTDDDYGVISAEARFGSPEIEGRPTKGRTLVEAPLLPLTLPPGPSGLGEGKATLDLSDHPWGGARVSMTMHARDEGGNEGLSPPLAIYLPTRHFSNPLARSLAEQRRNLVLEPDARNRVLNALKALMIEPDQFAVAAGPYIGLSVATARLADARSDPELLEVADLLWAMARQIEDGGLSDTEQDMRAAERQLRDALQRNAPEEEIRKLTEDLRAAMDKFLNEMAQRQQREGEEPQRSENGRSRTVTRDELKNMLDRMEQMARSGDVAEAQRMLDQLQNMLENLRTARRSSPRDKAAQEMNQALSDLDRLMRDQQQLRDDSYREGQKSDADRRAQRNQKGKSRDGKQQSGEEPGDDGAGKSLQQRQSELSRRLGEIQRRMPRRGGPQQSLDGAQDAMKEAGSELGAQGDRDKAVDAQGRALEAMRNGADQLAKQMQGQPSEQMGEGEGQQMGEADGDSPPEADPLGRPSGRDPRYNPRARYDPLGASPALRAQRVLEELRRRLGDVSRPQEELDYLERLIKRY